MILDIDIGNTRLKWRLSDGSKINSSGAEQGLLQEMLHNLSVKLNCVDIDRIRIAHVLGLDREIEMQAFFKKSFNLAVEISKSVRCCGEVTNHYKPPEKLGVDRWLGILAAFNKTKKSCCVVDCGSAITVDFVLGDGAYIGGYIAPGLNFLGAVLAEKIQQLPSIKTYHNATLSASQSTDQAISNGALLMAVSFIEKSINRFFDCKDEEMIVFLTGGDAELIAKYLEISPPVQIKLAHDLVLNGLSIALP